LRGARVQRRILFVDDEPDLLLDLKRTLRPMRKLWEMEFVPSGDEALGLMSLHEFDAVVTDMRMPGMSGVDLLNQVQKQWPGIIRILLSDQADQQTVMQATAPAHQFLVKPCDLAQLRLVLDNTLALTDLLLNTSLKSFISGIKSLPSLPLLYQQVTSELQSEDPSTGRIGEIVAQDMAMTAKLLQIVNSAGYGIRAEISEPKQAAIYLGLDTIRALVLSLSIFSAFDPHLLGPGQAEHLWEHAVSVSKFARMIAVCEGIGGRDLGPYISAGLLHDIGKLVMASSGPENYRRIMATAASTNTPLHEVELQEFGCTHAEVGAYLLGVWGLPDVIVEAVAWNHRPLDSPVTKFSPLAAVHVASAIDAQLHPDRGYMDSHIDQVFLDQMGLGHRLENWVQCCTEQASEGILALSANAVVVDE
jgi:HD-like signal output (HDOD) protein/CheY-like chemotaxis protein